MAKNVLEFANFTLVFGTKGVMADFLDQIVIPAFTDTTYVRRYGETTYQFLHAEVLNLGTSKKPEPAIVGTFIKDTVAGREQILNRQTGQLEKSPRKWQTTPSVTFALVLATHKLLYLRQTSDAPGFDAFKNTVQIFLMRKYFSFIDQEYVKRKTVAAKPNEAKARIAKKGLRAEFEAPLLSIVPLQSKQGVAAQIKKFKTLQSVKITLEPLNSEHHNNDFFVKWKAQNDAIGARKSVLLGQNNEGLIKDAVTEHISPVVQEGTATISLHGIAENGDKLDVKNDDLRLRVPVTNLPLDVPAKAERAYNEFQKVLNDNTLVIAKIDETEADSIRKRFKF